MSQNAKLNVLIVDDEPIVHLTISTFLEHLDHHAHSAHDGKEAIQKIENETFDLVLLDIRMPGMDGFGVLEKVQPLIPPLRIVVMTGHGDPAMSEKAKSLGAYQFVLKPLSLAGLQEMIKEIIAEKNTP